MNQTICAAVSFKGRQDRARSRSAPMRYTDWVQTATTRAFMSDCSFDGLLVIDRPAGMTSRDAVNHAQRWFPRGLRMGHTGTLDPLATGVLVLCIGAATRLTEYVQRLNKTYRAGFCLGARSDTDDADGS